MKIKNISDAPKQFTDIGQIIYVAPGETVDTSDKARYDTRVFEKIDIKKSKESEKSRIITKEVRS